jgi:hypothetical protein
LASAILKIKLIFGFLIMMGTVMLTQGVRKVPIHSTRRSATVGPFGFGRRSDRKISRLLHPRR